MYKDYKLLSNESKMYTYVVGRKLLTPKPGLTSFF